MCIGPGLKGYRSLGVLNEYGSDTYITLQSFRVNDYVGPDVLFL